MCQIVIDCKSAIYINNDNFFVGKSNAIVRKQEKFYLHFYFYYWYHVVRL